MNISQPVQRSVQRVRFSFYKEQEVLALKTALGEMVAENEYLNERIKRLKHKNAVLKKQKAILIENTCPESVSSDSELEFKMKLTLPINIGVLTILSLGKVSLKPGFHTDRYIYPIGFSASRQYLSMVDPKRSTDYVCTILDGGDAPKFQVVPQDDVDNPIVASSATGAWTAVIKIANKIRNKEHSNSASGPDYFGYSNPKELDDVDQCFGFKPQTAKKEKVKKEKTVKLPLKRKKSDKGDTIVDSSISLSTQSMI